MTLFSRRSPRPRIDLKMVEDFFRCGGTFSFEEWALASPDFREIAVDAANRVDAERAALYGIAGLSRRHAAAILSGIDGGALLRKIDLEDVGRNAIRSRGEAP